MSFIVIDSVGFGVIVVVVIVVAMVVTFWGQEREKWPSSLQNQHNSLLPSTTTIIAWSLYLIEWSMA